jgi:KUP system potassium uptake protein
VYGDIGTSPLYALRECFKASEYGLQPTQENVYGVLSLIVWSLIMVVSVKYLAFIMRADNRGEGGILALLALLLQQERRAGDRRRRIIIISIGLFGAALLYGDGVITPSITVLSAIEGLGVARPALDLWIVIAISIGILVGLFSVQRFGTGRVGVIFGPAMLVWFASIGALGLVELVHEPRILQALSPLAGFRFFAAHGVGGFLVLGAVVLAITGAEALYADMGHFGRRPIRIAWFALVLPALLLNYFGQGALILRDPAAAQNPFYLLAPSWFLIPLVAIATLAAIIASQALISGAFSLTQQSVQLGYSPRVTIIHTSAHEAGQIYIPEVNKLLAVGCVILVMAFRSSSALGAAYGIAVTGTMAITTMLFYVVARSRWNWSPLHIGVVTVIFLSIDFSFLAANAIKIEHGGWVPIAMAVGVYIIMSTWKTGRIMLNQILYNGALPLDLFLEDIGRKKPIRVPGHAVFMTSSPEGVPVVLLHHLKHNKVLHEHVILMSIITQEVPEVPRDDRVTVERLAQGFFRVTARFGFMETPDVPDILNCAREHGLRAKPMDTTFYLGRERIIIATRKKQREPRPGVRRAPTTAEGKPSGPRMQRWRKKLFVVMSRNARSATEFFSIPPNRVVELGAQVEF